MITEKHLEIVLKQYDRSITVRKTSDKNWKIGRWIGSNFGGWGWLKAKSADEIFSELCKPLAERYF